MNSTVTQEHRFGFRATHAFAWTAGLALASAITVQSHARLSSLQAPRRAAEQVTSDDRLLPSPRSLMVASFGFRDALADFFWLTTVSYFGKHYATDQHYESLQYRCNLLLALNPNVYDPYHFCATMLAWETHQIPEALDILERAEHAHPDDWFFPYERGFYQLFFNHDGAVAKNEFLRASQKPNANPIAARLAAKTISELESPDSAISFLRGMIRSSQDPLQKKLLQSKLDELLAKQRP